MLLVKFTSAARVLANEISLIQIGQCMVANDTLMCTGRQFNDKSCLDSLKRTRLLCQGSAENKEDLLAPSALRCLYGLFRRHKLSTRTQERFPQHVKRTGYRRLSTLSLSSYGHPLEILACISAQGPPRPFSTLPPPLSPFLFRRCSETTIYLRTITIPRSDPSKFWESAKSAGEDIRVEG
ncbi:hypothetical protein DPMN_107381 [Dreissena polymorpha]|uniref:Uncharacterized protein n=1 Tax=Dreissena polymorpha TaxID=45954 RepID=A0A9D4K6S7_DREPO|nr:hypothetical protein DPMN_107381 [Dreissena polymorpha]